MEIVRFENDAAALPVVGGSITYIDAADFPVVAGKRLRLNDGYVTFRSGGKRFALHRVLLGLTNRHELVDHADMDKLNNRRSNLRVATKAQNAANIRKLKRNRGTSSEFKGVSYCKRRQKWKAYLRANRHDVWLGYHVTELDAARAYDRSAVEHFGAFARLNFPSPTPSTSAA